MTEKKILVTPRTRIGDLLEAYPTLEEVLIEISPVFAKLKNPMLRRTMAKVATLQQAALIGGMPVEELVNRLRKEIGQDSAQESIDIPDYLSPIPPGWYSAEKVADRFDATHMINAGDSPMNEVVRRAQNLTPGQILELSTPFVPAPIIEILQHKGFSCWTSKTGEQSHTYIQRFQTQA